MSKWIKNCGLTTAQAIQQSLATGVTHIGLMHYAPSPRHLTLEAGAAIRTTIACNAVAVMVAPDDNTIEAIMKAWAPDTLQLHGINSAERLAEIRTRFGLPIIYAHGVRTLHDIQSAEAIAHAAHVDSILLDTAKSGMHGGTGESFDWNLLAQNRPALPWFLAGGLTPENVTKAVTSLNPTGVDVSSGIETSPGIKSLEKIAAFNAAVLRSGHEPR